MSKRIPLSKGQYAIVDDADFEKLNRFKWHVNRKDHCVYASRGTKRSGVATNVVMHREILGLNHGDGLCIDHINHNGLDNRRCNLRICTNQQNQRNSIKSANATSRHKGVYWDSRQRRWRSRIKCDGKDICLGSFHDESEAAKAYDAKAIELFGEFASLNSETVGTVQSVPGPMFLRSDLCEKSCKA